MNKQEIEVFVQDHCVRRNGQIDGNATHEIWWVKRGFLDKLKYIREVTDFLPRDATIGNALYHIKNKLYYRPTCVLCNKTLILLPGKTYRKYCGARCGAIGSSEKRETTNIQRFGVSNPFKSTEIIQKIANVSMLRYGVNNPAKSLHVRALISDKIKRTVEQLIKTMNTVHYNRYTYENFTSYTPSKKIEITCGDHGVFLQTVDSHISGSGCPRCANVKLLTTVEVIEQFIAVHGDRYNYNSVKYHKNSGLITIVCKQHGPFKQCAYSHKNGRGCPQCVKYGKSERQWLTSLNIPNLEYQKRIRVADELYYIVDGYAPSTNTVYEFHGDFWHGNPKLFSSTEIHPISNRLFGDLYNETKIRADKLRQMGYTVVEVWESNTI